MPFGSLGTIWAEIGLNTKKLDAGLMQANLKLATADRTVSSFGQRLTNASTKLITAGGLMVGAVAGVGIASIKMAADFEKSMRNVNSISRLSEQQFAAISNEVLQLSTKMPQSAKTLADGLYDIASSGFAGADGMKVLEASAKAASAGITNTATSAKGIVAVLNAYGYSANKAGEISDTMFRTVDKGIITFEELSSTIGDVIGTASIADISFNELSGALGYMTTKGISAGESTTALNRLILSIIDPSKELATVLKAAGYESGEMALQQIGLVGVMDLVTQASGGSLTKLQEMVPEMRALKAAAALTGSGIDDLTTYMNDFKDTTGATDIALQEQSKSLEYQFQILKNNLSVIGIKLGNEYIPKITSAVTSLSEFISEHQDAAVSIINLGLTAVGIIGGLMLLGGTVGKVRLGVIALKNAFNTLNVAAGTSGFLGTALSLAPAVTALAEPVTGLAYLLDTNSTQLSKLDGLLEKVNSEFSLMEKVLPVLSNRYSDLVTYGIYQYILQLDKLAIEQPEAMEDAQDLADQYIKNKISLEELSKELLKLLTRYQESAVRMDLTSSSIFNLNKHIKSSTELTIDQKIAIQENEAVLNSLMGTYGLTEEEAREYAKTEGLLKDETEDATGAIEDQIDSVDKLRSAFNKLVGTIFDGLNATNDMQEAEIALIEAQDSLNQLIKEGKQETDEYIKAENELDDASQEYISTLYGVYSSLLTTTEQKEEAKKKAMEYGAELVNTGKLGEEAFVSLAKQFGLSGNEIIDKAQELGIELDEATKERLVVIEADTSSVDEGIKHTGNELAKIDGKTAKVFVDMIVRGSAAAKLYAMGGMVGYDMGGLVGQIPQAQYGYVLPQTGRKIPVMAEAGELILNTSEQRNLAEWLMEIASMKPEGKGGVNVYLTVNSPEPLTPSEVARQTKNALRLMGTEASL